MNFWRTSIVYNPILCRLLARVPHGRPLKDYEVAARAGLTEWMVAAISRSSNWSGVDLPMMRQYLHGCGVDFCNVVQMKRVDAYRREQLRLAKLGRSTWRYLKRSPDWQSKYQPMFLSYLEYLKRNPLG